MTEGLTNQLSSKRGKKVRNLHMIQKLKRINKTILLIVAIVLLILFSMDYSSNNLLTKFIYIGAMYTLIKSNSFVRDFIGGVSTTFTQNVENIFKKTH